MYNTNVACFFEFACLVYTTRDMRDKAGKYKKKKRPEYIKLKSLNTIVTF